MSTTLVTAPTAEPLSREEVKNHLRVTTADEDDLIDALIVAAREHAEAHTKRAFITQEWDLFLDYGYPKLIEPPFPPLQSVTSITYLDGAGASQTEASSVYTVDADADPGRIYEAFDQSWSSTRYERKAVTVRYIAGYGDPEDVPQAIKQALLLHIGHLYENREVGAPIIITEVPMAYDAILSPYQVVRFD